MSDSSNTYVGLDTGTDLTLLGCWTASAGENLRSLDRSWPARARIRSFRATTAATPEDIQRIARELCGQAGGRPEDCLLVRMGRTSLARACEIAAGLGMRGVLEPLQQFVLWSEGVLPAQEVKEYARPVPPTDALDLDLIRSCFAELMEQAARDLESLRLDQDDSLLDQFVDARLRGRPDVRTVPVESLTDPARFFQSFQAAGAPSQAIRAAPAGQAGQDAPVDILTVRIRSIISTARLPTAGAADARSPSPPPGWTRQPAGDRHTLWLPPGR